MPIIKDLVGLAKSKFNRFKSNSAFRTFAMKGLPGGVLGEKNYNIVYKKVTELIEEGKHQEALDYTKDQRRKVRAPRYK